MSSFGHTFLRAFGYTKNFFYWMIEIICLFYMLKTMVYIVNKIGASQQRTMYNKKSRVAGVLYESCATSITTFSLQLYFNISHEFSVISLSVCVSCVLNIDTNVFLNNNCFWNRINTLFGMKTNSKRMIINYFDSLI